jgi:hypothetical protein
MAESMIATAHDLMEKLAISVCGNGSRRAATQGEELIEDYAIKCITMMSIVPSSIFIKDGIEYVHDQNDPFASLYSLEDEIKLIDFKLKNGLKTMNLFSVVKSREFNEEVHEKRLKCLFEHRFYSFCNADENVSKAFNAFTKRTSNEPDEVADASGDDWRKALFFGGFACILVRLMAWIDSFPGKIEDKPKKKLMAITKKIESLLKDIEGTEFDYGLLEAKMENYISNMIETGSRKRMVPVFIGHENNSISQALKSIATTFNAKLENYDNRQRTRTGRKEVVRILYLMLMEALMEKTHEVDDASIRRAVLVNDGAVRDLVLVFDGAGVNDSASDAVDEIIGKVRERNNMLANSDPFGFMCS